jgi:hypothetical protein
MTNLKTIVPGQFLVVLLMLVVSSSVFHSCGSQKLLYSAPVKPGDSWSKVQHTMPKPDRSGDGFASFFELGIAVTIDETGGIVKSVVCSYFGEGRFFKGTIFNIKLGDTYPKCAMTWGPPLAKTQGSYDYYSATWKVKKMTLEVEFWKHDGFDENLSGAYEAETVKRIKIIR